jgi:hypothetical protein
VATVSLEVPVSSQQPVDVHPPSSIQQAQHSTELPAASTTPIGDSSRATGSSTARTVKPQVAAAPDHQWQPAPMLPDKPLSQLPQTYESDSAADATDMQTLAAHSMGPVDIVYLWVNGSDAELQQELHQLQAALAQQPRPQGLENPAKQSRFDAGRDELRYSLRSVEKYMPWYNHIYIVTNRQVWLTQLGARRFCTCADQWPWAAGRCW